MAEILGIIIGVIGLLISVGSCIFWWSEQRTRSETKAYAAQREFVHIKNSLLQLTSNLANDHQDIERRLDDIRDDLKEIKISRGV